jgi:hypothetical protein
VVFPFYRSYDVLSQSSAACKALKELKTTVLKRLASAVQLRPRPPCFQSLASALNLFLFHSVPKKSSGRAGVCLNSGQQSSFGSRCGSAKTCTDAGQVVCRKLPVTTDCFDALPESGMGAEQPLHHSHFGWYVSATVQIN